MRIFILSLHIIQKWLIITTISNPITFSQPLADKQTADNTAAFDAVQRGLEVLAEGETSEETEGSFYSHHNVGFLRRTNGKTTDDYGKVIASD